MRKSSELKKDTVLISPSSCPICERRSQKAIGIKELVGNITAWYSCVCGVIFNVVVQKPLSTKINVLQTERDIARCILPYSHYLPLTEELSCGRMLLDVGYQFTHGIDYARERGWLAWGIDIVEGTRQDNYLYTGDFLDYDFHKQFRTKKIQDQTGEKKLKRTFDLIWFGHVLEEFQSPVKALKKAYDLLSNQGVIYISTPDTDFINLIGSPAFPHWKSDKYKILWNKRSLTRELDRLGFDIIYCKRNFSFRFNEAYDLHILAQKRYF